MIPQPRTGSEIVELYERTRSDDLPPDISKATVLVHMIDRAIEAAVAKEYGECGHEEELAKLREALRDAYGLLPPQRVSLLRASTHAAMIAALVTLPSAGQP